MLEIADLILGLFNLLSTWRFFACLALAIGVGFVASPFLPEGNAPYVLVIPFAVIGIAVGAFWQIRHDRQRKRPRARRA